MSPFNRDMTGNGGTERNWDKMQQRSPDKLDFEPLMVLGENQGVTRVIYLLGNMNVLD